MLHSWGAPLGEPVADDFDCLHRALFVRGLPLFDGYGSAFYWRPLSRQVYFKLFGPLMLARPGVMAGLHVALLALAALLLFRALRPRLGGPSAALAASFPLLMESARMLIAWPSNFQDLGAILFASLAIHEAASARLPTTLMALLASLLCKELMAPAALLLVVLPAAPGFDRRARVRWAAWIALTVSAWAAVYAIAHRAAGLAWPAPSPGAAAAAPWLARWAWACWNTARAAFSLEVARTPLDALAVPSLALLALAAAALLASRAARARVRRALPLALWGLAWLAAGSLTLAATYPDWSSYRGVFAALGLGVTLAALAGAAHPALAAALLALRLALFALSPGPPARIAVAAHESGALFDFAKLVRVQRLVGDTRQLLQGRLPYLAHGARVGQHSLPRMAEYAFLGSRALEAWYRDSTLSWVRFEELRDSPRLDLATIVEYQPDHAPQVALVDPPAMRALIDASDAIRRGAWREAIAALDRADSLQRDPDARVLRGTVAAKRAVCRFALGEAGAAEREALRGLELWHNNFDSRYVLASLWADHGRLAEAEGQLDSLLRAYPGDRGALELRERVRAQRAGR